VTDRTSLSKVWTPIQLIEPINADRTEIGSLETIGLIGSIGVDPSNR